MKNKLEDRRVTRTKEDLKKALFSLLNETNDLKKISIVDITQKANYNRATFYVHYSDKYMLVEEIIDNTIASFIESLRNPYHSKNELNLKNLSPYTLILFDYVESESETFKLLLSHKAFIEFKSKFIESLEHFFQEEFIFEDQESNEINKKLFIRTQAYYLLGVLTYWIDSNFKESKSYMAEQLLKIALFDNSIIKISSYQ